MKFGWLVWSALSLVSLGMPASAASDPRIAKLTMCRESWLDWKEIDPSALDAFGAFLGTAFSHAEDDGSLRPKTEMTLDGLKITRVFPGSVGTGLGFSVILDATFDEARQAVERDLGKPLSDCQAGEGMRTCELSVAEKRTIMLVSADSPNDRTTLAGCYYFYEK